MAAVEKRNLISLFTAQDKEINPLYSDTNQMFRKLVETVRSGVYIADAKGALVYVNPAFAQMLGYASKEEVLGRNLAKELYANPEDRDVFLKAMENQGGFVCDYEVRNICKDGSVAVLSTTSNFIRNDKGEVVGVEGIVQDITEKKKLEERLQFEKSKLEQILFFYEKISSLRRLDDLIDFVVKESLEILEARQCSLMFFDPPKNELSIKMASGLSDEVIEKTRIKLGEPIAGAVAQDGQALLVKNIEYDPRFGRKNRGRYATRSFMIAPIKIEDRLLGLLNISDKNSNAGDSFSEVDLKILCSIVREAAVVMDNARLYNELEYLSSVDPVTNLSNNRSFTQGLDQEIRRLKRIPGSLSLLMIDVDDFKKYNDTFGHVEGDHLLKMIGQTMLQNLRSLDKIYRYGGDEFAVILPGTEGSQAQVAAEKIRTSVAGLKLKNEVTISIGLAEFKGQQDRLELISSADKALYQAKKEGKNRVCV